MKTDLEADMASECNKLGPVDKVFLRPSCLLPLLAAWLSTLISAHAAMNSVNNQTLVCVERGN